MDKKDYALGDYLKTQVDITRANPIMVQLILKKLKAHEITGNEHVHLIDRAVEDWEKAQLDKAPDNDPRRTAMNELSRQFGRRPHRAFWGLKV